MEHYINTVFEDRSTKRRIVENKEKQYETYMTVLIKIYHLVHLILKKKLKRVMLQVRKITY